MCDIVKDRIRINKILAHALSMRLDNTAASLEELTQLCVVALQLYYDGACPDACVEAKARTFAVWHLARMGYDIQHPPKAARRLFEPANPPQHLAVF